MKVNVKSSTEFFENIRQIVERTGLSYLDAVTDYCEDTGLEPEVAATLIKKNPTMKALIQTEAEDLRLIAKRKGGILPV